MKPIVVPGILITLAATAPAFGQESSQPPYRVTHPAQRVTCFNPGLAASPITSCVVETDAGLVVIDTGLSPSMAKRTRARIVSELGRDDIRWVINTHSHFDHSGGNQVFADAIIIGHENTPAAMRAFSEGREGWIERRYRWLARQEAEAADAPAGSQQALALEERLRFNHEMIEDLRNGYRSTPPTITFSDRLSLQAGDLELRLIYFGRAHTDSDILIHIPDLAVFFTGDLFHDEVLGTASSAQPFDVDHWFAVLDAVLSDEAGIDTVIGGHGLLFTPQWIAAQRRYLGEVWRAVGDAKAAGTSLAELTDELPFDTRFSFIAEQLELEPEELARQHREVLQKLWRVGQLSAADEIGRVVRESGTDAATARWAEIRNDTAFLVDERELNSLGYQLLQRENKVAEALAVFGINTQAFPDSWNVWDSFAEAHWWINDQEGVERNYRKALALNPEAESARRGISQIEGYRLDRAGETKIATAFAPGAPTGLDGPYLGQVPPGTEPEVFAPGIVSTAEGFEFSIAFTPDGREIYFARRIEPDGGTILMVARHDDEDWIAPEPAAFAAGLGAHEPHVTPDGARIFFNGPPAEGDGPGIWVADRQGEGWSSPTFHGVGMFTSSTHNGDLFMASFGSNGPIGIVRYPKDDDGWGEPERLGGGVNEPRLGVHGWVAPDGSFIVFDSYQRPGAQGGEGDLFVAFRTADGGWGEAHNLGDDINTPGTNFCPSLSPDGKFLFFATNRDIYWVSSEVIHRAQPD